MVESKNTRDKKEHFNFIEDIVNDTMKLAIAIGVIVLIIGVIIYFLIHHNKSQGGAGFMEFVSDTSPMAQLTNTPTI